MWKLQRSAPVLTSYARMSPGDDGSASATVLPMMSKSSKTTPGVLALTDMRSVGRPSPARRSTHPLSPNDGIGLPDFPVERVELVAIREDHAIAGDDHAAMPEPLRRRPAAVRIEAPELFAGRGVEREHAQLGRRRVQHAVDHDRIRLHLRIPELVVRLVRPRHLQLADVLRRDLVQRRVVRVVGVAAVDGPVDVARLGRDGRWSQRRRAGVRVAYARRLECRLQNDGTTTLNAEAAEIRREPRRTAERLCFLRRRHAKFEMKSNPPSVLAALRLCGLCVKSCAPSVTLSHDLRARSFRRTARARSMAPTTTTRQSPASAHAPTDSTG